MSCVFSWTEQRRSKWDACLTSCPEGVTMHSTYFVSASTRQTNHTLWTSIYSCPLRITESPVDPVFRITESPVDPVFRITERLVDPVFRIIEDPVDAVDPVFRITESSVDPVFKISQVQEQIQKPGYFIPKINIDSIFICLLTSASRYSGNTNICTFPVSILICWQTIFILYIRRCDYKWKSSLH